MVLFEELMKRRIDSRRSEFGMLCAVFANSNAFGGGTAKQPSDFYPDPFEEKRQQTPQEHESILRAMFSRFKKKT